jgi:hypothetical protein
MQWSAHLKDGTMDKRQKDTAPPFHNLENALLELNNRITARALDLALGGQSQTPDGNLYEGFEELLRPEVVRKLPRSGPPSMEQNRIYHTLLSHYLQWQAMPYENELSQWAGGAAAIVDGEKVYLREIHTWCQKNSTLEKRLIMEKETSSLSKFLKPFALAPWTVVLETLHEELGYSDYVAYCSEKKGLDYTRYAQWIQSVLDDTADLYFQAMTVWVRNTLGISLSESNRFDAIYLVGLGQFDSLCPSHLQLAGLLDFFKHWGIDVGTIPGLHLHLEPSPRKSHQGLTFALKIPEEAHVSINPSGGWIDIETLFHEMGHGLGIVHTRADLPPALKDFNTSSTLSEAYAFLLQNMCFTPPFLERVFRLGSTQIDTLLHYKALKDMAFFRRYAAKFLAECRMFRSGDIANGQIYADVLNQTTGFSYKPETHLFDLAPELYALDYVISWTAEANLQRHLHQSLGDEWMFKRETGEILKDWWSQGNRHEIDDFFEVNGLGTVRPDDLTARWKQHIR